MKRLFGTITAVGLSLVGLAQPAAASWETRTAYRWDPACCRYVACQERVWVPDCAPTPGPVYFRGEYRHHHHHDGFYPDRHLYPR